MRYTQRQLKAVRRSKGKAEAENMFRWTPTVPISREEFNEMYHLVRVT